MNRFYWESIYQKPISEIPWEISEPPKELLLALKQGWLKKNDRVLDIACGTGNYSIFLAKLGFKVTGIDISEKAISLAKEKSKAANLSIDFLCGDVLDLSKNVSGKFDFIFDYSILHHIPHDKTFAYVSQFRTLLAQKAKYLLVCYSTKDSEGLRTTTGKFGNAIYYRRAEEIRSDLSFLKEIYYSETTLGKRNHHFGHFFVFENLL